MVLRQSWTLPLVWGICIGTTTQCLSRYTTKLISGYSCQASSYLNISNVLLHQCAHTCLRSKNCWTLSYSRPGRYCLLAEEPCVMTEVSTDFAMMILRSQQTQHCLEWMRFNSTYGVQYGYPKRAVQGALKKDRLSVAARLVTDTVTLTGRSISNIFNAYLLDSNQNKFILDSGFEILVVQDTCSTAWVAYTPRDPIPTGAVVAATDIQNRNHYVVSRKSDPFLHIGGYIEGEGFAYHPSGDNVLSFVDIFMLISLA